MHSSHNHEQNGAAVPEPAKPRPGVKVGARRLGVHRRQNRELAADLKANPGSWKPYPDSTIKDVHHLVYRIREGHAKAFGVGFDAEPREDPSAVVGSRVWVTYDGKTREQREKNMMRRRRKR